ncbi:MAG: tetratricopeptide repeat protein, partial [Desulfobacterales bacterium]|nr:tetratricopeptide repeat protein [Desulfobacterales bacterium]
MNITLKILVNALLIIALIVGCTSRPEDKLKYYEQAKTLYESKDYTGAKEALEKAIEIDPEFAGGYANLGEVYLKLGEVSKAVDALEKAIDLKPDLTGVQLKLAFLNLL